MDEFVRKYFQARRCGYRPSAAARRSVTTAAWLMQCQWRTAALLSRRL